MAQGPRARVHLRQGHPTADYANSDLCLLWGHNPARVWLAQSTAIANARARGATVAVVDPRSAGSGAQADLWVRVRPGSDGALALGVANRLIQTGRFDDDFIRRWSNGPLLVREDTGRFLRGADLTDALPPLTYVGFDGRGLVPHDTGDAAPEGLTLRGTVVVSTRDGEVRCTPAFERYEQLCAEWTLERTAAVTWAPEADIAALADALAGAKRWRTRLVGRGSAYQRHPDGAGHRQPICADRQLRRAGGTSFARSGGQPGDQRRPIDPGQRAKALGFDEHPLDPRRRDGSPPETCTPQS